MEVHFLTGQAILWMATVFGYFAGLRGIVLILVGGFIGACFAIAMPAVAQPIIRKITGSNDIALGHFCTIGYLFEAGVSKLLVRKVKIKNRLKISNCPRISSFCKILICLSWS